MKQRLGIAQALIHDPQLIILDEPTTGLDPQGMKEIRDLIIHLSRNENKTIFLSSHILHEVELIATRMIIISKGKTRVEGTVDELLDADSLNVTFEVDDISRAMDLIKHSSWNNDLIKTEKNRLILKMKENEISELNKYLINDSIAVSAIIPTRSLEDYFLKITEGGE